MFFTTIFFLGALHGVALSILLATKKVNCLSNRVLGGLMMVFSIDLAMAAFFGSGLYQDSPWLIGFDYPITMLYGPLLYLYTETLVRDGHHFNRRELTHFIPFVALLLFTIPLFLMPNEEKIALVGEHGGLDYGPEFFTHIKVVFNLSYIPVILFQLRKYQMKAKDSYSTIEQRNLDWLKGFIYAFLILALVSVVIHLLSSMEGSQDKYSDYMLLAVTIFVYSIGYMGLRQADFFARHDVVAPGEKSEVVPTLDSYSKSGLSEERGKELMEKLERLMETQKPFTNNELSLRDLSEMMDISTHNLTEIINRFAGKNFYDFVNSYRVEEVKQRLQQPESTNLTMLALGMDAGFNSKSSFNSVFKKHTGMTPTEFKKQV